MLSVLKARDFQRDPKSRDPTCQPPFAPWRLRGLNASTLDRLPADSNTIHQP